MRCAETKPKRYNKNITRIPPGKYPDLGIQKKKEIREIKTTERNKVTTQKRK